MEEVLKILGSNTDYYESVVAAFRQACSLIMKTNCYQLTVIEFDEKFHFIIPPTTDHRIEVFCDRLNPHRIVIFTIWGLQQGAKLEIDLLTGRPQLKLNDQPLTDMTCLNPMPAIKHIIRLVDDLNLPAPANSVEPREVHGEYNGVHCTIGADGNTTLTISEHHVP